MNLWFNARELAELKLMGLPETKQGIIKLVTREKWQSRKREGTHGGGREYPLTACPPEAQDDFRARQEKEAKKNALLEKQEKASREIATIPATDLTARQRAVMEARAAILNEIESRISLNKLTVTAAIGSLVDDSRNKRLSSELAQIASIANDRSHGCCTLSERSLFRWRSVKSENPVTVLAPKATRSQQERPEWFDKFLRLYARKQKPSVGEALREWKRMEPTKELPTYWQVRNELRKMGSIARHRGREGSLALKARLAYKSRDTSDLLPSSIYVADGKTFDAEVAHPIHGQAFRPEITTIVDAHTRKITGWSVDLDENRFAVLSALRKACCEASIPAIFYTDRGPGYKNSTMLAPLTGFLGRLSITPMHALPYNSQAKGIVERVNHLWNEAARLFPTYIGAPMDKQEAQKVHKQTRKELKVFGTSRLLPSWSDFLSLIANMVDDYNNREHSGLLKIFDEGKQKNRHLTPNEMWNLAVCDGWEPVLVEPDEANDLFRPWVVRKARRCLVEWLGNSYFSLALEEFHGRDIIVAYDISDASQVWLREIDFLNDEQAPGRLIGIALFEGHKTRYIPISYERDALEKRARGRKKRLENKLHVVDQELRPAAILEQSPVSSIINITSQHFEPVLVEQQDIQENNKPVPVETLSPNGRPNFRDNKHYAQWLINHPEQFDSIDAEMITDLLISHTQKEYLRTSGVDLDALRCLVKRTEAA